MRGNGRKSKDNLKEKDRNTKRKCGREKERKKLIASKTERKEND